ncbi:MAG: hypothetical protein HPPSJP_0830 [Candidatus Hepatoplasma scabrum]|nr:MAG: hypothetical protein HPPSJP_0830 [Candidatus Hepatoplasma sp.]
MKIKGIELTSEEKYLILNIDRNLNNNPFQYNILVENLNQSFKNIFFENEQKIFFDFKKNLNYFRFINQNYIKEETKNLKNKILFKRSEYHNMKINEDLNLKLKNISKLFVEKEKAESLNFLGNLRLENNKDLEEKYINLYNKNLNKLVFLLKDQDVLKIKSLVYDYELINKIKKLNFNIKISQKKHNWFFLMIIFLNIILLGVFIWILIIII